MQPRTIRQHALQYAQERGFSLLEILVAVGILLVLTGITVPIASRAIQTYRLTDVATQVAGNIKMARFEAIRKDALVNWQIKQAGNTTTVFVDPDRAGNFGPKVKAAIFNTNLNVVPADDVPNTAGLAVAIGAKTLTPVNPLNTAITFDARGAVTGVPTAYAVYISDNTPGSPGANYRAVILLPSGITQIWLAASDGAWRQLS
ncbi:MAG TPA: prepilin-type N-terminal cleavage/methylation domain-containing protein [Candidatus Eremiobacteraceae bacterium]|nr:prepilin-type N-terminal cleavage/methylation domain-containing protein [Candidatus Eremiobacteraceae bacterium]